MKHISCLLICVLTSFSLCANINFIDISKISSDKIFVDAFNFVKDNQEYYAYWSPEWQHNVSKRELEKSLEGNFTVFSSVTNKNEEVYLLLGDIAHYLYNLDDSAYYKIAVRNYDSAKAKSPSDFRVYWFLGFHYAVSNLPEEAVTNFIESQKMLPVDKPADFWNEFALTSAFTNMPSHCIYAMDMVKSISGKAGSFETQLGPTIRSKIIPVDKNNSYKKEEIWTVNSNVAASFMSRPLGVKILVDTSWDVSLYEYAKHSSAFVATPAAVTDRRGITITYTIAIIMKTVDHKEQLKDFINGFVSKDPDKVKINFSEKYQEIIAYEVKDKTIYENNGGGHIYYIAIERDAPNYPGLALENPYVFSGGKAGEISYYKSPDNKGRFNGKIFYLIMLDTCEAIHDESLKVFKAFFNDQLIIE